MSRSDRGSVLLLFPASFMVMLVLGAVVLDLGLVQVRARELHAVASSAANDALAALDQQALRDHGIVELDGERVRQLTVEAVAAGPLPHAAVVDITTGRDAMGRLEISVTLRIVEELVITPALPGTPHTVTLTRTGTAVVLEVNRRGTRVSTDGRQAAVAIERRCVDTVVGPSAQRRGRGWRR